VSLAQGRAMAQGSIYNQFLRQCSMLAYLDVIKVLAIAMMCLIPLVFLMKRPPKGKGRPAGH
jgi:DHA2 family multidrug resistance protein